MGRGGGGVIIGVIYLPRNLPVTLFIVKNSQKLKKEFKKLPAPLFFAIFPLNYFFKSTGWQCPLRPIHSLKTPLVFIPNYFVLTVNTSAENGRRDTERLEVLGLKKYCIGHV